MGAYSDAQVPGFRQRSDSDLGSVLTDVLLADEQAFRVRVPEDVPQVNEPGPDLAPMIDE